MQALRTINVRRASLVCLPDELLRLFFVAVVCIHYRRHTAFQRLLNSLVDQSTLLDSRLITGYLGPFDILSKVFLSNLNKPWYSKSLQ
ncbi:MAG TPA: hypothetical protein DCM07_03530 [Planctomycetaceae bacterium]|nr:hypothetical protein [Gimesia sp.]HAH43921.1 hypothetical protein [Planctomycetaceae bacterium]HBL45697.1 hypothetical protein [Planctomycetaceae bacterium]